jgi:hypothetical protein
LSELSRAGRAVAAAASHPMSLVGRGGQRSPCDPAGRGQRRSFLGIRPDTTLCCRLTKRSWTRRRGPSNDAFRAEPNQTRREPADQVQMRC